MKKALIAGSFDPITKGHVWMIEKARELFDDVIVAVAHNPQKKSLLTVEERQLLIYASLDAHKLWNITMIDERDFTVTYARDVGCTHIVRGIRNTTDFEFEHQLNLINREISGDIETVYLMPPRELIEVSSSMVKSLMGLHGWEKIAGRYVTDPVLEMLRKKADVL